ncbi:MAG: GNAT family N-acetyltransferase [Ferruginibacter sp.]
MLELNFQPFPVINTNRLLLRATEASDLETLFRLRSDTTVMRYIDKPLAKNREDIRELLQKIPEGVNNNTGISRAIEWNETKKMIGQIGFWRIDKENHRGEVGYMLLPEYCGMGIGSEALAAALKHGFTDFKLHSVEANVNPENAASIRMLEKQGFVKEAYFRENYYYNGKFLDSAIFSLLATDHRR